MDKFFGQVLEIKALQSHIAKLKEQSNRIVFTNGCFDLLHPGHVTYLAQAKSLGDILVVGLDTDESVKKLKGSSRPIQDQDSRAKVLSALRSVDFI